MRLKESDMPSEEEWDMLIDYIGGKKMAGAHLKEAGVTHWSSPNSGADNSFGFNAIPGGLNDQRPPNSAPGMPSRQMIKSFDKIGKGAFFWTSTKSVGKAAIFFELQHDEEKIYRDTQSIKSGLSVRCIRNN